MGFKEKVSPEKTELVKEKKPAVEEKSAEVVVQEIKAEVEEKSAEVVDEEIKAEVEDESEAKLVEQEMIEEKVEEPVTPAAVKVEEQKDDVVQPTSDLLKEFGLENPRK